MKVMKPKLVQQSIPISPVELDNAIAIKIVMGSMEPRINHIRTLMARQDLWHKITVIRGSHYDKDTILKAILKAIDPIDMVIVNYQVCGDDTCFIARDCNAVLEQFCRMNLIINNIENDYVALNIILAHDSIYNLKIHIQPIVLTALLKRYNSNQKMLNLKNFRKDQSIDYTVYCPLSKMRTFHQILKMIQNSNRLTPVEYLDLQCNELMDISPIENSDLTTIKYLDLRHNNLLNMNALTPLRNLRITRLWLDGNPLCENYATATRYMESAKKYCPYLQELDGVIIVPNMPLMYRDYFTDEKTLDLVRKFAWHFFTLYDQVDRTVLRGIYHKDAFYSMSFGIPSMIAQKQNLAQYSASRNLLRKGPKKNTHLYHGEENILANLINLPKSYHDKSSFKYDVMYDNGKCVVVNITGLFKKLTSGTNILSFSRTFVLLASLDDEYHILNDQNLVDAAPKGMTPDHIIKSDTYDEITSICFSPSEKSVLINRLKQITKMNNEWCKNYLMEAEWDMRQAVLSFKKDYKSSAVPDLAFVS